MKICEIVKYLHSCMGLRGGWEGGSVGEAKRLAQIIST